MKRKRIINWAFWIQWILANGSGWIVGMSLTVFIGSLVEMFTDGLLTILAWGVVATIAGLSMGINQWLVLSLYTMPLQKNWLRLWVVVTTLAWVPSLVIVVGLGVGEKLNFASSGAIIGMMMGIAQWFVIRRLVKRAEWWAIANTIGWTAGLALVDLLELFSWQVTGYLLAGLVSGSITGLFLLWLITQPVEEVEPAE